MYKLKWQRFGLKSQMKMFEVSDMAGYKEEFLRLFGFGLEGVDYEADVNPEVNITHLISA